MEDPISFDEEVFSLSFSPVRDIVACGLINGDIFMYEISDRSSETQLFHTRSHKKACNAIKYSPDGKYLYSGSSDKAVCCHDIDRMSVKNPGPLWKRGEAHDAGISAMLVTGENLLVTGDEDGAVKTWDRRTKMNKPQHQFKENSDFIPDFVMKGPMLVCPSGDGTIAVLDIRRGTLHAASDPLEDELLSIALIKRGRKVVCGTQSGVLDIFSWGNWGDMTDRFPGHPESVDALVAVSEDTICTGSSDGIIRMVTVQPNSLVGVVGTHKNFPVERLAISCDGSLLGSCSHDKTVRIWDLLSIGGSDSEEEDSGEERDSESSAESIRQSKKILLEDFSFDNGGSELERSDEEIENDDDDDDDDDVDDDDDDDDDEVNEMKRGKKKKRPISEKSEDSDSSDSEVISGAARRRARKRERERERKRKKIRVQDAGRVKKKKEMTDFFSDL